MGSGNLSSDILDGSHPKAARFATTAFLFLGLFYALIGAAGILGYLSAEIISTALTISPLCIAAAVALAARTDKSLGLAVVFGVAAIAAPYFVADVTSAFEQREIEQANEHAVFITAPEGYQEGGPHSIRQNSMLLVTLVVVGLVAAYAGRRELKHPFSASTFPGLVWEGLRMLTRKDGTALIRLAAGVGIILLGVGLAFLLTSAKVLNRGTGKAVVGLVVAGAALAASALSFFPERP